jgi:hypothetical protein
MATKRRGWLAGWLLAGAALALPEMAPAAERIGVELTVSKASGESGKYRCQTTVKDLTTNQVLAAPDIFFRLGEPAKTSSTDPATGLSVEISVAVTGAGEQFDHVVLVRRGDAVVAAQSGTVHLPL